MPHGEHAGGGSTPRLQTANDGTGAHRGILPDAMADYGAARGEARTVVPAAESKATSRHEHFQPPAHPTRHATQLVSEVWWVSRPETPTTPRCP